jgi:hypothetical protein
MENHMSRKFVLLGAAISSGLFFFSGCNMSENFNRGRAESFTKKMQKEMNDMNDPKCSIPKVREFALEKLNDATDEELDMIQKNAPIIKRNYDGTEYAFLWVGPKGKKNIEVVATPPPCEPVAVFRVRRVYYP